jgi:hypothetical protein
MSVPHLWMISYVAAFSLLLSVTHSHQFVWSHWCRSSVWHHNIKIFRAKNAIIDSLGGILLKHISLLQFLGYLNEAFKTSELLWIDKSRLRCLQLIVPQATHWMCLSGIYTYVPPSHVSETISLNHSSKSGTRMMVDKKSRSIALI